MAKKKTSKKLAMLNQPEKKLAKPKKKKKLAKNWQKVQNKLAAKSLKKVQNWPQKLWNTKLTINSKAKKKREIFLGQLCLC